MYITPKYHSANFQLGQKLKKKKGNNAEQERLYVFQHRKVHKHTHHGVVRFWRRLYKEHAHTHTTTKKIYQLERTTIASNRCFHDCTQPHAKPFPRTSGTCFAHFFFSRRALPEIADNSAMTVPSSDARGLDVSSARSWKEDPGDPPLYVQPLPPIGRWLGHRQGVFIAESVGRQVNQSSVTGARCCCL